MKLREEVKGVLGIALLYLIVLLGIVLVNARLGAQYTNVNQKINK